MSNSFQIALTGMVGCLSVPKAGMHKREDPFRKLYKEDCVATMTALVLTFTPSVSPGVTSSLTHSL